VNKLKKVSVIIMAVIMIAMMTGIVSATSNGGSNRDIVINDIGSPNVVITNNQVSPSVMQRGTSAMLGVAVSEVDGVD
jgi:hypothetical protein